MKKWFLHMILYSILAPTIVICQDDLRLSLSGGISYLLEAAVAAEVPGHFLNVGLEKRSGLWSYRLAYEKVSCASSHSLGISRTRFENGEWFLSRYKGYIDLERRDFAFMDIDVDPKVYEAGTYNEVGARQIFTVSSIIAQLGYRLVKYQKLTIRPAFGLAISKVGATARNISYTTELLEDGRDYLLNIPTYVDYLYVSMYLSAPFEYKISDRLGVAVIGNFYYANQMLLPSLGVATNISL